MIMIVPLELSVSLFLAYLLNDEKKYEEFGKANTDGIFQFEAKGAKNILKEIDDNKIVW